MGVWRKDPEAEQIMANQGVAWDYTTLPIGSVAPDLMNRARLDSKLDQELVQDYALHFSEGDQFPSPVAYDMGGDAYRTASGNHRLAAALAAGVETVDAYVISRLNSRLRLRLELAFNDVNGVRVSIRDRVRLAIEIMAQEHLEVPEAAIEVRVRPDAIYRQLRLDTVVARLGALGFSPTAIHDLGGPTILTLLGQTDSDPALATFATYQSKRGTRLTRDEIFSIMSEVKKYRDDASKVAFIQARYRATAERQGAQASEHGQTPTARRHRRGVDAIRPSKVRTQLLGGLAKLRTLLYSNGTRSQAGLLQAHDYQVARDSALSIFEAIKGMPE